MRARSRSEGRPPPPVPARAPLAVVDHPGRDAANALAHRQLSNAVALAVRQHARGRLLDIGCGHKPYQKLLEPLVDEHVGVDHPDSPHASTKVDVLASAYEIPLPDGRFETVLMTEVLEHLEEPARALAEALRLLTPGGTLILTSPFVWPLHEEPRDFFRYSPHGLRHILTATGFEGVEVTPISGQWTTLAITAGYVLRRSPVGRAGAVLSVLLAAAQRVAVALDERQFEPWLSWNHVAVAHRPY